jgi:hypothetical protein
MPRVRKKNKKYQSDDEENDENVAPNGKQNPVIPVGQKFRLDNIKMFPFMVRPGLSLRAIPGSNFENSGHECPGAIRAFHQETHCTRHPPCYGSGLDRSCMKLLAQ